MIQSYNYKFNGDLSQFGRVAVLYGGTSAEREVSLLSGSAILSALQGAGVDAFGIDIDTRACEQIIAEKIDFAFIGLHGVGGEDGKIQALLDLLGIPYTGSDHAASALAMNKLHTKQVWQAHGLPTPPYMLVERDRASLETVLDTLGHVFVKPIHEGSSFGISPARSIDELDRAVKNAQKFDSKILAEKLIHGEEYSVSILGDTVLPPIQLKPASEFYDYEAKYISNATQYICPCDLSRDATTIISALAKKAFQTVGCKGWGRVDFMRNTSGEFFLLEVNTVPGMTAHSLVPMAARQAGLSFEQLVLEVMCESERRD